MYNMAIYSWGFYENKCNWIFTQNRKKLSGDEKITFKDLNIKAQKLAVYIAQSNIIRKPIALYLPKSIESVIADIAITYSGNAYMNLDIKNPIERISNIHNLIKPEFVITNNKYKDK